MSRYSDRSPNIPTEVLIFREKSQYSDRKSDNPTESPDTEKEILIFRQKSRYSEFSKYRHIVIQTVLIFGLKSLYSDRSPDIFATGIPIFRQKSRYSDRSPNISTEVPEIQYSNMYLFSDRSPDTLTEVPIFRQKFRKSIVTYGTEKQMKNLIKLQPTYPH